MKKKDYYEVLGVSRTENISGIRDAFRRLAKVHHPDVAGSEKTCHFQEMTEAYTTLCNPEAREDYNQKLRKEEQNKEVGVQTADAVDIRYKGFIRHEEATRPLDLAPATSVFENFFNDFLGAGLFAEPHPLPDLEVILSLAEAKRGGLLAIPVSGPCTYCGGSGRKSAFACFHCSGRGSLESGQSVRVQIPTNIQDGTLLHIPFTLHSQKTSFLRVLIRVGRIF